LFETARGIDETFIVYEDEDWTFAEVMEEVDALSHALVHHYGVKPGDRVGIASATIRSGSSRSPRSFRSGRSRSR